MDAISQNVFSFLFKKGFIITEDWFNACMIFVFEENKNSPSIEVLADQVIEQLIFSDISETCKPILKNQLNIGFSKISQDMILQVNYAISISDSYYSQLNNLNAVKFLSVKNKNKETEITKSNPVFMLELTDGFIKIKAITIENVNWSNNNNERGFKLKINKGVHMRRGILLLTNKNCQYLGGSSETINEKYNLKDILKTFLHPNNLINTQISDKDIKIISKNQESNSLSSNQKLKNEILPVKRASFTNDENKPLTKTTHQEFKFSDDSLDEFLNEIDDAEFNNMNEIPIHEIKTHSTKPSTRINTLNFKTVPKPVDRPYTFLSEILNSNRPFLCKCYIKDILSELQLLKDGSVLLKVEIEDESMKCHAFITNTLLSAPPFLASKSLVLKSLNGDLIAQKEFQEIVDLLKKILNNAIHCLLVKKIKPIDLSTLEDAFEILAIYDKYPDEFLRYSSYIESLKNINI